MRKAALILGGLVAGAVVLALLAYALFSGAGPIPPATVAFDKLTAEEHRALVDRGRYVARAADCAACHVSEDGVAYAGGFAMATPFGTIYGTNITPSRSHGIGGWTADDLYRAVVWGILPDGGHLYPAMPYTSYHAMERADVDALWAYLMTRPPIDRPDRKPDMAFPFNIRPAIAFWNMLFRPGDTTLPAAADKSEDWRRGRYLVDVLGHCGDCHTPRNLLYAKTGRHLRGEVMEGDLAPDISPKGLSARGWTAPDLKSFLSTGLSRQGSTTLGMYPVLEHSTRHLTEADLDAIASYLLAGAPPPATPALTAAPGRRDREAARAASVEAGRHTYVGLCAGCHGTQGEGRPHASVPLATNTTAMFESPHNLIKIIRDGVPARRLAGSERMQEMPAFRDRLSDREIADLANYLRATWGGRPPDVTAGQVAEVSER
ncbi:c-type cytochrome [Azospirillum sp. B2RO_4]|uniref:c-type cytochrome n=1 Tax=Azospirillum sp. B2RO_4 TaxID=3027796 RepID=UPI003DA934CC